MRGLLGGVNRTWCRTQRKSSFETSERRRKQPPRKSWKRWKRGTPRLPLGEPRPEGERQTSTLEEDMEYEHRGRGRKGHKIRWRQVYLIWGGGSKKEKFNRHLAPLGVRTRDILLLLASNTARCLQMEKEGKGPARGGKKKKTCGPLFLLITKGLNAVQTERAPSRPADGQSRDGHEGQYDGGRGVQGKEANRRLWEG